MEKWIVFGIVSMGIILISRRTLFDIRSHGFYRFFGWELILLLFLYNYKYWFKDPFCANQVFSWIILIISGIIVIAGVVQLRKYGKSHKSRIEKNLYQFEMTSRLVDTGIYKYIRHPLYASLIYLAWGIYLKNPTILLLLVVISTSIIYYVTAIFDEKECVEYFGDEYRDYIKRSKMFIPFVF